MSEGSSTDDVRLPYGLTPPDALYDLADSLRRVVEQMVRIDEGHPELVRAETECAQIAARLEGIARQGQTPRMMPDQAPGPDDARPYYPGDAAGWHYNPFHPPLQIERSGDDTLRARCTLGLAHEGPPGCVHGGFVSMLFDAFLGHANVLLGRPGLTARLTVRYRRPTPLFEELLLESDPPVLEGERRCTLKGRILHDGVVTATGEALFSRPPVPFTPDALLKSQR